MCENQGWDIEVKAGHIGKIDVNIPWNSLMQEDSYVEIKDLYLEIRPKCRPKDGASMIESMWSSMSSSMQLAKDCLEQEIGTSSSNQPMEGLERFAQIIDSGKMIYLQWTHNSLDVGETSVLLLLLLLTRRLRNASTYFFIRVHDASANVNKSC